MLWPLFSLVLLFFLSGCGTNPVTGESELQFVSEPQEIAIGEAEYKYIQQAEGGAFVTVPSLQAYVESVGEKIAAGSDRPHLPYEFIVLNSSIPNAWALPGGKIGINRGMLLELHSEAELAAVLAHEIAHSAARHGAKRMEKSILMGVGILSVEGLMRDHKYEDVVVGAVHLSSGLIALKYSRRDELEADRYGMKYMFQAGYHPQGAVILQETFLSLEKGKNRAWLQGLLSTHPPSQERLEANRATAAQYLGGYLGWEEYDKAVKELKGTQQAYRDLDAGYTALKEGKASEALELADHGITIAPWEGHLYNLKGKALRMRASLWEALVCFDKAIELNPEYFDFYLQRGLLKQTMGDYSSARRDLLKSQEFLPSAEAEYALGVIALQSSDRHSAMIHFQRAALNPSATGQVAREQLSRMEGAEDIPSRVRTHSLD